MHTIVQISDLHLTSRPGELFKEVDPRKNLLRVLNDPQVHDCDLLVVSGDMAAIEPEPEIYVELKSLLDALNKNYHILPGNHDGSQMVAEIFGLPLNRGRLHRWEPDPVPMILLDSSTEDVTDEDLEFLESSLNELSHRRALLFIHHPLIDCAHPRMDRKYFLKGRERLRFILERNPKVQHVFCGHAHKCYSETVEGINYYVTPSTVCEFYSSETEVSVGHRNPGFRKILYDSQQGLVDTRTIYLG